MKFDCFPEKIKCLEPHSCRFDAFKMKGDNCEIYFASYPPGANIEPHDHDTENYGVVTKGSMCLVINGEKHEYKTGDWYHIPANAEHSFTCDTETEQIEFWFKPPVAA